MTGEQVSREINQNYRDGDGNVAADVVQVGAQFDANDGISEADVADAESDSEFPTTDD